MDSCFLTTKACCHCCDLHHRCINPLQFLSTIHSNKSFIVFNNYVECKKAFKMVFFIPLKCKKALHLGVTILIPTITNIIIINSFSVAMARLCYIFSEKGYSLYPNVSREPYICTLNLSYVRIF